MHFYENYLRLCKRANKTPSAAALEMGLSKPTVNRWKNGGGITDSTALIVADYFGVPVEALMGEEPEQVGEDAKKERPAQGETLSPEKQAAWELLQKMDDETLRRFIRAAQAMLGE